MLKCSVTARDQQAGTRVVLHPQRIKGALRIHPHSMTWSTTCTRGQLRYWWPCGRCRTLTTPRWSQMFREICKRSTSKDHLASLVRVDSPWSWDNSWPFWTTHTGAEWPKNRLHSGMRRQAHATGSRSRGKALPRKMETGFLGHGPAPRPSDSTGFSRQGGRRRRTTDDHPAVSWAPLRLRTSATPEARGIRAEVVVHARTPAMPTAAAGASGALNKRCPPARNIGPVHQQEDGAHGRRFRCG